MREDILKKIKAELFLDSKGGNVARLLEMCKRALSSLTQNQGGGALFPSTSRRTVDEVIAASSIPEKFNPDFLKVLDNLHKEIQAGVNANSQYTVRNIMPQANFLHMATYMATSLYMLNAVSGENSSEGLNTEIACASAMAKLAGYDGRTSAGVFTFSGVGTNLYGVKMGLSKISNGISAKGLDSGDVVVVAPRSAHYSFRNVVNWLGIGTENCISVETDPDQTVKIDFLEKTLRDLLKRKKKIACILLSGGTTSNMAIDDIEAVFNIRNFLAEEFKLDYVPHIHVDSVIGWVYLNFKSYDFEKNVLGLSKECLKITKGNYEKISKLQFADSFGIDFHKTGYIAYTSSIVIVKDKQDFDRLGIDFHSDSPLFHNEEVYNPGKFTLETSRSCANIIATWNALQAMGQEGYQVLIASSVELAIYFRQELAKRNSSGFYLVNRDFYGSDIYIRCYSANSDGHSTFEKEQNDMELLRGGNDYTSKFYKWFNDDYVPKKGKISIGKTNSAMYTKKGEPVVAIRIYLLNLNLSRDSLDTILDELVEAKSQFDVLDAMKDRRRV